MTRRKTKVAEPDFTPPPTRDTDLVAIDPGDRYTGVAFFKEESDGWYCQDAQEFEPHAFEDALAELLLLDRGPEGPPIIVYEKWRLYEDKAKLQTGSEMLTSQHIGVILYICRIHNEHVNRHEKAETAGKMMTCELQGGQCEDPAKRPQRITVVKQPADIKKPTAGILRHKKIKSVAKPISRELYGGRDHVIDAELHGWKHILDTMGGKARDE